MFDLTVHKRNSKGQIISEQPYRLSISGGQRRYERPVGSNMWYFEDGKLTPESAELVAKQEAEAQAKADQVVTEVLAKTPVAKAAEVPAQKAK